LGADVVPDVKMICHGSLAESRARSGASPSALAPSKATASKESPEDGSFSGRTTITCCSSGRRSANDAARSVYENPLKVSGMKSALLPVYPSTYSRSPRIRTFVGTKTAPVSTIANIATTSSHQFGSCTVT
jgi:hypothetical protein